MINAKYAKCIFKKKKMCQDGKKESRFHFTRARCEEAAAALLKCPSEYLIALRLLAAPH